MRKIALIPLLVLAGCTVGPDLHRPEVPGVLAPWVGSADTLPVDDHWWKALHEPQLDALVDTALAHNLDIRIAEANLLEARANRDAALGGRFPAATVTASGVENGLSKNGLLPIGKIPGITRQYSLFDSGFDASWEIDLWGGQRRAVQAASARADESQARRDDMRLQVIAEVARAYIDLRTAQAQVASAEANLDIRRQIALLYKRRFEAGESPNSDVGTALQRLDTAEAAIPGLSAQRQAAAYRLALLTGQPPEAMVELAAHDKPLPDAPAIIAAGIRSELLQRRPDIRAADADLVAFTADIGVAKAQIYPRFSIVGSLGQQARTGGDLLSTDSTRSGIGPSFSWPIFSAGKIRAQVRGADARALAATARYEKAVLGALNDSQTALNRFGFAQYAQQRAEAAHADNARLSALVEQRFKHGEDDRIQWLEAQSTERAAQLTVINAKADTLAAYVSATKALGGGW
jgi:NodT family efflux transporter outer membrane factor (OMF) lipoprotein